MEMQNKDMLQGLFALARVFGRRNRLRWQRPLRYNEADLHNPPFAVLAAATRG